MAYLRAPEHPFKAYKRQIYMCPPIHGVMISDSRGKNFDKYPIVNEALYETHHISCSGARVPQMQNAVLAELSNIPSSDLIILYICGGSNELTFKEYHSGGVELSIHRQQHVLTHLLDLKSIVRRRFPNCVVGYSTIPIISFKKSQAFYQGKGDLWEPKYSCDQLQSMQKDLSNNLACINVNLTHQNRAYQYIPNCGMIKPNQLYWHQEVEKCIYRKTQTTRRVIKRIPDGVLSDGVHATRKVEDVWHRSLHNNFAKMAVQLLNAYYSGQY